MSFTREILWLVPAAAGTTAIGFALIVAIDSVSAGHLEINLWRAMLFYPFVITLIGLAVITLPFGHLTSGRLPRRHWVWIVNAVGGLGGGFLLDIFLPGPGFYWMGAFYGALASVIWAVPVSRASLGATNG